jgi:FKBP-type peptidyl-prolyl cis-trans isomerase SlyD
MSRDTSPTDGTFEIGEFVEIEYTARIADGGTVVDTTDPSVAAESGLDGIDAGGPVVVIVGEGHVFEPVEDAITEMRPDESRTVQVPPADAFGETDPNRRRAVDADVLARETIEQGDRVSIDGQVGHVDSVEDGTVTLDFNHPLAGVTLEYDLRVVGRIVGLNDRTDALLRLYGLRDDVTYTSKAGVVRCRATRSSVPDKAWDDRKRQFLETATEHLDAEEIRFEEQYATG